MCTHKQTHTCTVATCGCTKHPLFPSAVYYGSADKIEYAQRHFPCPALDGHLCKTLIHDGHASTSAVLGRGGSGSCPHLPTWHPMCIQNARLELQPAAGSLIWNRLPCDFNRFVRSPDMSDTRRVRKFPGEAYKGQPKLCLHMSPAQAGKGAGGHQISDLAKQPNPPQCSQAEQGHPAPA